MAFEQKKVTTPLHNTIAYNRLSLSVIYMYAHISALAYTVAGPFALQVLLRERYLREGKVAV